MELKDGINSALEHIKQNDYKSAEEIYLNLVEEYPNNSLLLTFIGYFYMTTNKYKISEKYFEKAYSINSTEENVLSGLAFTKYRLLKYEEGINLYQKLIKLNQTVEYYEKITSLYSSLISIKDNKYANEGYNIAIEANKKYPLNKEILCNLSIASLYCGKFSDAEKYCNDSLKIDCKYPKALQHYGLIQESLYKNEELAQEYYKKALKHNNKHPKASIYYDLGISCSKSNKYNLATRYFNKALKEIPNNERILTAAAFNYFKQQKFKQGAKYYLKTTNLYKNKTLRNPWDGKTYKDKTLFIYPDMAFGDHIQFIRYIPLLENKFKKIIVQAYPQLIELFKNNFDNIEFTNESLEEYDYSIELSKLICHIKDTFIYSNGYLNCKKAQLNSDKLKVGICWEAGNSDIRTTIHRTINIHEFSVLFEQDIEFYSFQVNPTSNDYLKYNIINLGKDFKSFNDTATYLKAMDVVISVDTSVANLAGALGIKTLLLLPYYADWRWFKNNATTQWYDSVTIFKQKEKHSWKKEINEIKLELTKINIQ